MFSKLAASCSAATLLLLGTSPVLAQGGLDDSNTNSFLTSSSTSTSSSVVTSAGLMLVMVSLTPERKQNAQLAAYLNANLTSVRQGLTLGAGSSMNDLAQAFRVPASHRRAFGSVMRRARPKLLPLLAGARVTLDGADSFVKIVHGLMLQDSTLGPGARRLETNPS